MIRPRSAVGVGAALIAALVATWAGGCYTWRMELASVELALDRVQVSVGEEVVATASTIWCSAGLLDAGARATAEYPITFTCSNPEIAGPTPQVTNAGEDGTAEATFSGLTPGTVTIVAAAEGVTSRPVAVTVVAADD